jgi:hypothetical protein
MVQNRKIIAIDFDGTLSDASGKPISKIISYTNACFDSGNFIVVYTARIEVDRTYVSCWLKEHGVKYDLIELGKLRYDLLVDDRTIHPDHIYMTTPMGE